MEKLPERWAVERTPENYKQVNEWAKVVIYKGIITNREIFNCTGGYLHSDGAVYKKVCYDYMLLSSSQFMQLVYNPWKQAQNGKASIEERFMQACEILELLVKCKSIHDNPNATVEERKFYDKNKPIAWMMAKAFLTK